MAVGRTPMQPGLLSSTAGFCEGRLAPNSIYAVLHRECGTLFPDEMFADLFAEVGRRSVPPMIVAVVMVLQRWKACRTGRRWSGSRSMPAGGTRPAGWTSIIRGSRTRCWSICGHGWPLRTGRTGSSRWRWRWPAQAGLVGRRRVLDSTPFYDAVATMDTVTLIRSAIRGLLAGRRHATWRAELRAVLASGDDYAGTAKPVIDWDDPAAREALVDARARDGYAVLAVLDGPRACRTPVEQAAQLLATVLGQDLEPDGDGVLRIARRVAKDRVISTVDPEARHGHKTADRGFDGYKGHVAIDPDSEIITATAVTAGNTGDAEPAAELIADLTRPDRPTPTEARRRRPRQRRRSTVTPPTAPGSSWTGSTTPAIEPR